MDQQPWQHTSLSFNSSGVFRDRLPSSLEASNQRDAGSHRANKSTASCMRRLHSAKLISSAMSQTYGERTQ
eukprot:366474-Chlamydomonas_euryale.AAC.12